jgi:hypothetical protein
MQIARPEPCIVRRHCMPGLSNAGRGRRIGCTKDQLDRRPMSSLKVVSLISACELTRSRFPRTHPGERVINECVDAAVLEQTPSVFGGRDIRFAVECCEIVSVDSHI